MVGYLSLALLNGFLIGVSRTINARLGSEVGPVKASAWNHLVGFIFLLVAMTAVYGVGSVTLSGSAPLHAYLGGVIGAFFVALNSWIFPHLGAMRTTMLVIAGQMLTSTAIDAANGKITSILSQAIGVVFILAGIRLSQIISATKNRKIPGEDS